MTRFLPDRIWAAINCLRGRPTMYRMRITATANKGIGIGPHDGALIIGNAIIGKPTFYVTTPSL